MKNLPITFFLLLCSLPAGYAQQLHLKVQPNVDTSDTAIKKVANTWRKYLASEPDSVYDNPYWNKKEKQEYKIFDFLRSGYLHSAIYKGYQPILLAVTPEEDHYYQIKTAFLSQLQTILCVANVYAKKVNGSYKLFNALPLNTKDWQKRTVGTVTYHFKKGAHLDEKEAKRMNDYAKFLQTLYRIKPIHVNYYIGKNLDELMKLDGLETYMGMGNPFKISGYSDVANGIIFSGGGGAYYPHEMTHIYVNRRFPNTNKVFLEGIAVYYGGSMGHPLKWHLKRLNNYLHKRPEISLRNFFSFSYMDNYTNPQTIIGGLLLKLAFKKGGTAAGRKLMRAGQSHSDFYEAVKDVFGVDRNHLNKFLRHKIKAAANGKYVAKPSD
jgi:hypothetical protein